MRENFGLRCSVILRKGWLSPFGWKPGEDGGSVPFIRHCAGGSQLVQNPSQTGRPGAKLHLQVVR